MPKQINIDDYIQLHVYGIGDMSVGIGGDNAIILIEKRFINGDYGDASDCRKFIRDKAIDIFKELFDDNRVHSHFNDECPDCMKIITECKCRDGYE